MRLQFWFGITETWCFGANTLMLARCSFDSTSESFIALTFRYTGEELRWEFSLAAGAQPNSHLQSWINCLWAFENNPAFTSTDCPAFTALMKGTLAISTVDESKIESSQNFWVLLCFLFGFGILQHLFFIFLILFLPLLHACESIWKWKNEICINENNLRVNQFTSYSIIIKIFLILAK